MHKCFVETFVVVIEVDQDTSSMSLREMEHIDHKELERRYFSQEIELPFPPYVQLHLHSNDDICLGYVQDVLYSTKDGVFYLGMVPDIIVEGSEVKDGKVFGENYFIGDVVREYLNEGWEVSRKPLRERFHNHD